MSFKAASRKGSRRNSKRQAFQFFDREGLMENGPCDFKQALDVRLSHFVLANGRYSVRLRICTQVSTHVLCAAFLHQFPHFCPPKSKFCASISQIFATITIDPDSLKFERGYDAHE